MWAVEVNGMRSPLAELDSQLWLRLHWAGLSVGCICVCGATPPTEKLESVLVRFYCLREAESKNWPGSLS